MTKLKRAYRWLGWMCAGLLAGVTGCAPTPGVLPMEVPPAHESANVVVDGWSILRSAVETSEAYRLYNIKMDVDVAQGPIHSRFSVYGSLNMPDLALLSFHSQNSNTRFYQQGRVAYEQQYKHWDLTEPMQDLNAFSTYGRVIAQAERMRIPVYQLPDAYVVDQFCRVYQATVPMKAEQAAPLWGAGPFAAAPSGEVSYTFYVGKKDGALHEVQTATVGSVSGVGAVQIDTDTTFFDFNQKTAQVKLPNDLFGQLVGMSHQG